MGSFRLAAGRLHLHKHFNFAESLGGDSVAIVTPFVQVGTYPTKEFRYLRTVIVTAAVYRGFDQELAPHHLTFRHRAGVTPYIRPLSCLQSAVFLIDSRSHRFSATRCRSAAGAFTYQGIPSPEVTVSICQSSFSWSSLKRGISLKPTCVGLRCGHS